MLLDSGRLPWAASLPEARVLETELANVRTKLTANLHDTYNAREGADNDLLLTPVGHAISAAGSPVARARHRRSRRSGEAEWGIPRCVSANHMHRNPR
jgi:hypothetical protein